MKTKKTESGHTEHWANLAERGTMSGLRFMLAVHELTGHWFFRPLVALVVTYFFLASSRARSASMDYLNHVWSHAGGNSALSAPPTYWTSIRHFLQFAEALLDKLSAWKGGIHGDRVDCVNKELFEQRYRRRIL